MTKKNGTTEYIVVLGLGKNGKPHAARFDTADEALVRKGADLTWLRVARASGDEAVKLARKLPEGKLFASGKALVPLVKTAVYDELLKTLEFDIPAVDPDTVAYAAASEKQPETAPNTAPWDAIGVGSVVLAFEEDKDGSGWWEAVVIAVSKDGNTLSLRWRDWPEARKFSRPRHKVGILAPIA